jgi:hypothetical protein
LALLGISIQQWRCAFWHSSKAELDGITTTLLV